MNEQLTNMIEQQIRPWGVLDERVLELYRAMPREQFVSGSAALAYADAALPIGHGQCMLEPKLEARMLQALTLQKTESVLHIGAGSGFFAAMLGRLAAAVTSVEIIPELAQTAMRRLESQPNVKIIAGDGARGLENQEKYDVIVLTGATGVIAESLWKNLSPNGRLLAVVGQAPAMTLRLHQTFVDGIIVKKDILETCIPLLQNAPLSSTFVF